MNYIIVIYRDKMSHSLREISKLVSHKLYLLSRIRKYINQKACITIFKSMVLSLIEYGDIIYQGTSCDNLDRLDKLCYRGLRICDNSNIKVPRNVLCTDCHISTLDIRRELHLLLFMHKQLKK